MNGQWQWNRSRPHCSTLVVILRNEYDERDFGCRYSESLNPNVGGRLHAGALRGEAVWGRWADRSVTHRTVRSRPKTMAGFVLSFHTFDGSYGCIKCGRGRVLMCIYTGAGRQAGWIWDCSEGNTCGWDGAFTRHRPRRPRSGDPAQDVRIEGNLQETCDAP